MIDIIYEDNHCLIVEKPCNMPMQADSSKDTDLLTTLKRYLIKKYHKPGDAYLGLVHRLDRPVGGICIFAKTSKAAGRLSKQISEHRFEKEYLAVVADNSLPQEDQWHDKLLKNHRTNTTVIDPKGKEAILNYCVLSRINNMALVKIRLKTGRSHQIRVQFASRCHPLYGDQRYNHDAKKGEQIALWSYKIGFDHPTLNTKMTFFSIPDDQYPFTLFKEVLTCLKEE